MPDVVHRFRLLSGKHEQADPNWTRPLLEDGRPDPAAKAPVVTFSAGDVVESAVDLVGRFGAEKFEHLGEAGPRMPETVRGLLGRTPVNDHPGEVTSRPPTERQPTDGQVESVLADHAEKVAEGGPSAEPPPDTTPHDGTAAKTPAQQHKHQAVKPPARPK